ncbi:pyridoxal-dependent decarboxylase [Catellatospora citrea]|uniref:pyridoxal-dependent decarboxylase n=1 Tax=Catellatospora citrea TaxID=53366 RepID=UPI0033C2CFB3
MTSIEAQDLGPLWDRLGRQFIDDGRTNIGFPGATDIAFDDLAGLWSGTLLNNIGSPYDGGHGRNHTKDLEVQVVNMVADILSAPPGRWGYVTDGATEGTEHALLDARRRFPDAVIYASAAAHYMLGELAEKLMMPLVVIGVDDGGRIDVADLAGELARRRDRAAVIVAVAGTTMTEAVDDVPAIVAACDRLSITRRRVHVDAALSGLPLALVPVDGVPRADLGVPGVSSVVVSGHKFLSTLEPCGVLIYGQPPMAAAAGRVSYTGTASVTMAGSRSGHTTLKLYKALAGLGTEAHRARVRHCRDTAAYACERLRRIGVDARRHPHAFTVYFPPPPPELTQRWVVPADDRCAHLICMPQVTRSDVDRFVADWQSLVGRRRGLLGARKPAMAAP